MGKPHYPYMHKKQSKIAAREMEVELGLKKPVSRRKVPMQQARKRTGAKTSNYRQRTALPKRPASIFRISPNAHPAFHVTQQQSALKSKTPKAPTRPLIFVSSVAASGMCAEQRADYMAACEGKITWVQYFRKWGRNTPSL